MPSNGEDQKVFKLAVGIACFVSCTLLSWDTYVHFLR